MAPSPLNADSAYWYAKRAIKGRWHKAEPIIMKNPAYAYLYSLFIIKGRWPEAEPYIMDSSCKQFYIEDVIEEYE